MGWLPGQDGHAVIAATGGANTQLWQGVRWVTATSDPLLRVQPLTQATHRLYGLQRAFLQLLEAVGPAEGGGRSEVTCFSPVGLAQPQNTYPCLRGALRPETVLPTSQPVVRKAGFISGPFGGRGP